MPCSPSPASEPGKDETFHELNLWAVLEVQRPGWGHSLPPFCGHLELGIFRYFGYLELEG